MHATAIRSNKAAESPNPGRHGAMLFISPWRSDGAFQLGTPPRLKVDAGCSPRQTAPAAPRSQQMAGAKRPAMANAQRTRSEPRPPQLREGYLNGSGPTRAGQGTAENAANPNCITVAAGRMTQT